MAIGEIIAGPILRRLTPPQIVLWWVSPFECQGRFNCYQHDNIIAEVEFNPDNLSTVRVGQRAVVHLLDLELALPIEQVIEYDLIIDRAGQSKSLAQTVGGCGALVAPTRTREPHRSFHSPPNLAPRPSGR